MDGAYWKRGRAERFAVSIDAADYFASLRRNLPLVDRRLFILGWDLDSRLKLGGDDGEPSLAELLDQLVAAKPDLEVYLLLWAPSLIYVLDREPWQGLKFMNASPRVHLVRDALHPFSGSHHQKLVVLDDRLAYCGGIDLAANRWDTSAHLPDDPRRPYAPFHDCQAAVTGEPAAWLEELVRWRWEQATGERLPPPAPSGPPPAFDLGPAFLGADVAVARTLPAFQGRPEVREVERLFLAMFRSARRYIYAENQYLSAPVICDALAEALRREDGPEVVLVLPKDQDTLLSRLAMGPPERRCLDQLVAADRHRRLRLLYPDDRRLRDGAFINVHAKVTIVDDRLVRIGSANLNNRSMGLDSECDLLLDAGDDAAQRTGVRELLARFLGDHLGLPAPDVAGVLAGGATLGATIDALNGRSPKTLQPLTGPQLQTTLPLAWTDLPGPHPAERLVDEFVYRPPRRGRSRLFLAGRSLFAFAAFLAFVGMLTAAYPLGLERGLGVSKPVGTLILFLGFVLSGVAFIPLNLLMATAASLLAPGAAALLALGGSTAGALIGYAAGRGLHGSRTWRHLASRAIPVQRFLANRGFLAMLIIRLLPLAPFSLVNLVGGFLGLPLGTYVLSTLIGLLPGVVGLLLLQRTVHDILVHPTLGSALVFAAICAVVLLGLSYLARRFRLPRHV